MKKLFYLPLFSTLVWFQAPVLYGQVGLYVSPGLKIGFHDGGFSLTPKFSIGINPDVSFDNRFDYLNITFAVKSTYARGNVSRIKYWQIQYGYAFVGAGYGRGVAYSEEESHPVSFTTISAGIFAFVELDVIHHRNGEFTHDFGALVTAPVPIYGYKDKYYFFD